MSDRVSEEELASDCHVAAIIGEIPLRSRYALDLRDCRRKLAAALAREQRLREALDLWGPIAAATVRFVRAKHEYQEDAEDELRLMVTARSKEIDRAALAESAPTPAPREPKT